MRGRRQSTLPTQAATAPPWQYEVEYFARRDGAERIISGQTFSWPAWSTTTDDVVGAQIGLRLVLTGPGDAGAAPSRVVLAEDCTRGAIRGWDNQLVNTWAKARYTEFNALAQRLTTEPLGFSVERSLDGHGGLTLALVERQLMTAGVAHTIKHTSPEFAAPHFVQSWRSLSLRETRTHSHRFAGAELGLSAEHMRRLTTLAREGNLALARRPKPSAGDAAEVARASRVNDALARASEAAAVAVGGFGGPAV